jgi:hypothetical protein
MTLRVLKRSRVRAYSTVLSVLLVAASAHAQSSSSAAAQGLFDQGKALMAAGKAAQACPKFEESQRLDPGSGTLINLALCYEQTKRIASAWSTYRDAAAAARASGNAERERGARDRAAALAPKVSKLVLDVPDDARVPGLHIRRDGADVGDAQWGVPIPADDGSHSVSATAPGFRDWQTTVEVSAGGTTATVAIPKLEAAPGAEAEPTLGSAPHAAPDVSAPPQGGEQGSSGLGGQRIGALALGGVGVAGVVVGSIFGVQAMSKHEDAKKTCAGTSCTTLEGVKAGNDAHSAANVSTIALIAGGVALAGGLALWLTAPKRATQVGLTPGGILVSRSF